MSIRSSSAFFGVCLLIAGNLSANFYIESASTPLDDPADLSLESIAIVGEQVIADGQVLVEIVADVRNLGEAVFEEVGIRLSENLTFAEGVVEGIARVRSEMAEVLAAGVVSGTSETFRVLVDAADLAAGRDTILSGAVFVTHATNAFGEVLVDSIDVAIEEIVILAETTLADGRILIEFTAKVHNTSTEVLIDVALLLGDLAGLGFDGLLDERASYPEVIDPLEVVTGGETLHAIFDLDYADGLKSDILAGSNLSVGSSELWVFAQPPAGVDADTEGAWEGTASGPDGTKELIFSEETDFIAALAAGNLLIEVPAIHRLVMPSYVNPYNPPDEEPPPLLSEYLPFEVEEVIAVGEKMHVRGRQRQMLDVVVSGTFRQDYKDAYDGAVRDPYKPPLGNTYTEEEKEAREEIAGYIRAENPRDGRLAELEGMQMIPWHFNDFEISPKIKMSGEVLLKSSGLELEVKIREAQLETVAASLELGGELNILLETEDEADNTGATESERTKQLFFIPLPPVSFNIGGVPARIQPVITLDAGVLAVTPSRLYLPLQSAFTVGMEMGWTEADGTFYTPTQEVVPLRISDPAVFEDTAASVGAWVELGVMLEGSVAEVVNGGPRLAVRASTGFELTPLLDPWWSWNLSVDLLGQFNLSFLGLEIVETEQTLFTIAEENRDAGGPLIPGLALFDAAPPVATAPLKPLAGKKTRWARVFQATPTGGTFEPEATFLAYDPAGFFYAGGSNKVSNAIVKYTDEGDLLWAQQLSFGPRPYDAVIEPDGTLTVVGIWSTSTWIARFESDGSLLWSRRYDGFATPRKLLRAEEGGLTVYYLAGYNFDAGTRDYDPVLIKFDAMGDLLWAQRYRNANEDDQVHSMTLLADGDLVLSGYTTQDVEAPDFGTPLPGNVVLNASREGLLMRVDADGVLLWANSYVALRTMEFSSVVEADDGTLYVGGHHHRPISEDQPNLLFGRFASDGTLLDHVLIGDDNEWEDELLNGGNTPYDLVEDLRWYDGALWACGSTGLGVNTAAWVMKLTPELGALFYAVFDGVQEDFFTSMADTGDGIALWGSSASFIPWREGGEGAHILQVLPYEGMLRYHPDSGARSLYLQPWVYKSSQTEAFEVYSEINTNPPQRFANDTSSVPFAAEPLVLTELLDGLNPPVPIETALSGVVQATSPALIDDFESWSAYYGIPLAPGFDEEKAYWAAYLGEDPWADSFSDVSGLGHEVGLIDDELFFRTSLTRHSLVADLSLEWEFSPDLEEDSWVPIEPDALTIHLLAEGEEEIEFDFFLETLEGFLRPVMLPDFGAGVESR